MLPASHRQRTWNKEIFPCRMAPQGGGFGTPCTVKSPQHFVKHGRPNHELTDIHPAEIAAALLGNMDGLVSLQPRLFGARHRQDAH